MCPVKNKLTKADLNINGKIPVYSSESINNGIIGYTNNNAEFEVNKNNPIYIVFGDHTISFNIATKSFCVMDNVKVLSINEIMSIGVLMFIVSSWKRCIPNKGYSRHWSLAKNVLFHLPIAKNGRIDFEFIENFIDELESEHIAQLESYLVATGLNNYNLTDEEERVLNDFKNNKFDWKEFKIEDILQWQSQKEIDPLKLEELKDITEQIYPFYGQSTINNGIISYNQLSKKVLNNMNGRPTILIHSNNQNTIYLETPFYLKDGHGATSVLQSNFLNKMTAQFIITSIKKVILNKYSYNSKATKIELKNTVIQLLLQNSEVDYQTMETFISAIQKLVIKDVVLYADKKISATKNIVNNRLK